MISTQMPVASVWRCPSGRIMRKHFFFKNGPLKAIYRALHSLATTVQYVAIDHCGSHIVVAEKLLYGANVIATFEQTKSDNA
jgi:hypothetical protein